MALREPILYLAQEVWTYSKGRRGTVLFYCLLFVIANGIRLLEPLVLAHILNIIQEQGLGPHTISTLIIWAGVFILLTAGFWLFHGPARVLENINAFYVRANYKKHLLKGTMDLPLQWHADHHSGDTIDKINKGSQALFDYSMRTFFIIQAIVNLVGSYIALAFFNLHSAYIVAFMVFMTFSTVLYFDSKLRPKYRALNRMQNTISAKIFDTISNITTVIILQLEKLSLTKIVKKIMHPLSLYRRTCIENEVKWFLVSANGAIMIGAVLASYLFSQYSSGETILIGTVYALYGYVERVRNVFFEFAFRYSEIVRWKAAVENAEELSEDFIDVPNVAQVPLDHDWQTLSIEKLNFNYGDEEGELHLTNVDLHVARGERIALVGESGSGKTTFLKLLRALYTPNSVRVFKDDELLTQGFKSIASNVLLVPQDPELFTTTIQENITMGKNVPAARIKRYTDLARFTDVASRLPNGLQSSVVEKGVNLSGGEKQRLALARGLLAAQDKAILLLDEPTSSVDPKNELAIYKNIFSTFNEKTILSSIHRLHLLHLFDRIYLFKKGKIIAKGTLRELMHNKEFAKIWKKYTQTQSMHD